MRPRSRRGLVPSVTRRSTRAELYSSPPALHRADCARRDDLRLRADPSVRRPDQCRRRAGCDCRNGGEAQKGLRLRQAAAASIPALARQGATGRFRLLDRQQPAGSRHAAAGGSQYPHPGLLRDADRLHARRPARRARRLLPGAARRQACDRDRHRRRIRPPLLARHGSGHHLRRRAAVASGNGHGPWRLLRLGVGLAAHQASDPAGRDAFGHSVRHHHAHGARDRRRDP